MKVEDFKTYSLVERHSIIMIGSLCIECIDKQLHYVVISFSVPPEVDKIGFRLDTYYEDNHIGKGMCRTNRPNIFEDTEMLNGLYRLGGYTAIQKLVDQLNEQNETF